MKIAVCSTFPASHFAVCAAEMLDTFIKKWPQDVKIYIQLDEMPENDFLSLNNRIIEITGEDRAFISGRFDDEQRSFIDRWKQYTPKSYLDDIVKFSHKVFAVEKCADAVKDEVDYLIWLDADVITKSEVTYDWLKTVLPGEDEVVSYLDRKGLHSECGFVAYNMKAGGYELLKQMRNEYVLGSFSEYTKGATDCHVIDLCLKGKKFKSLCPDYVYGKDDINVWPNSALAQRMVHRKGNRKFEAAKNRGAAMSSKGQDGSPKIVDWNNMNVKTKNCLDHEKIKSNVAANISQIRAWATICRPSVNTNDYCADTIQPIVICAAGPSLSSHIKEIKELQSNGAKVVAVKHAIDTLKIHGIKPWAVVLLDPRGHVEEFIRKPDTDVIYFVASMCDPSVVKTLNDNKCKIIGYHAFVNAGEMDLMIHSDLPVSGGSATGTRSIGLFGDMFGHKTFHLFGFDLCYQQKPNMDEKNQDGQSKFMELNIGTNTYKNKYISRTFWTEGQFLAQSNEIKELYKARPDLNIIVYGDGMAGWLYKHWKLHKQFMMEYNENLEKKRNGTPTLDEFCSCVTRGADLSRGV